MQNRKKFSRGFSLIELLVVIAIIVLLSMVGLVSFSKAGISARNGRRQADLEQVRAALVLYRANTGTYPIENSGSIATDYTAMIGVIQSYLSTTTVQDPKNSGNYVYAYTEWNNGQNFSVCANLEPSTTLYCVNNP